MAENTGIEWADHTDNFWWGCTKVDETCRGCYAERDSKRYGWQVFGPKVPRRLIESGFKLARRLNAAAKSAGIVQSVFTNSMADVFEDDHAVIQSNGKPHEKYRTLNDVRADIWALIEETPNLVWLLLTKRPENILSMVPERWIKNGAPANVIFGTSAGTQAGLDARVTLLVNAAWKLKAKSFLSLEPLVEGIDVSASLSFAKPPQKDEPIEIYSIGGVIVGGESGPKSRPLHPDWARDIRDACAPAGVAFFFKQWGEWTPGENVNRVRGVVETATWFSDEWIFSTENLAQSDIRIEDEADLFRVGKKAAGRFLDGRTHDELIWPVGHGQVTRPQIAQINAD